MTTVTLRQPLTSRQRLRQGSLHRPAQRSVQRSCQSCLSCESLKQILSTKDSQLAEYSNRLKLLNQLESTIAVKGKVRISLHLLLILQINHLYLLFRSIDFQTSKRIVGN